MAIETSTLQPGDLLEPRHIGPRPAEVEAMLRAVGAGSLDELTEQTVPSSIRFDARLALPAALSESMTLAALRELASRNRVMRSLIGLGYADCIVPGVIQRNILENPGWYTQYTPYQAEIAQGRLEALLNFQTLVCDLTGLPVSNASLLDEGTAAAEAMYMAWSNARGASNRFVVSTDCHPQTIAVVRTRAVALGIEVVEQPNEWMTQTDGVFGVLLQNPGSDGIVRDLSGIVAALKAKGATVIVAADPLALVLMQSPGQVGADIAVGSMQRFGVPLGFGGPHAAFVACRDELKRVMPGRLVGVSRDAAGRPAYRLALQTREQHIRRDKATSNICTAQVLLAVMASMYAVYHGPDGLRRIATRVRGLTAVLAAALRGAGVAVDAGARFDTLRIRLLPDALGPALQRLEVAGFNVRHFEDGIGITLDERSTLDEVTRLAAALSDGRAEGAAEAALHAEDRWDAALARTAALLPHEVFRRYHAEHEMLRYVRSLEARDLSLTSSMIPLGSCTMKLNASVEMFPVSWPEWSSIHPFAPADQVHGYRAMLQQLEAWLAEITGFAATSLQPNAGSQGEYAGLLVIRAFHESRGDAHRKVCLIPVSAHGTNPASAVIAGFRVVTVACDSRGNVDLADLRAKAAAHAGELAALMITYPSTHGVFEPAVKEVCSIIHDAGGQVYMDGANLNAQVGVCRPGDIGADVCHINLHKTFCIPHGGGGPGMGPICVAAHLAPFLPGHPLGHRGDDRAIGPVSAAPYGSASILPIPWVYIRAMGPDGLRRATQVAILNANYIASRLADAYPILYTGETGRVAHELILDIRGFKASAGIETEDIAKRLMDYGFHAPTMSFPVPGTLMIEPTESEAKGELDRFCEAMLLIRDEIRRVEQGEWPRDINPLKLAPHTAEAVTSASWDRPYGRDVAAFPTAHTRDRKFWPSVARIDNAWGDRNLVCTCAPPSAYEA
jgi:glycine dehydrogenase